MLKKNIQICFRQFIGKYFMESRNLFCLFIPGLVKMKAYECCILGKINRLLSIENLFCCLVFQQLYYVKQRTEQSKLVSIKKSNVFSLKIFDVCVSKKIVFAFLYFFIEEKLYINVLNGMFSGALANALANPTDLLKVRSSYLYLSFIIRFRFVCKLIIQVFKAKDFFLRWRL
jgi:hypothetical protein